MRSRFVSCAALAALLAGACAAPLRYPSTVERHRPYWSGTLLSGLRLIVYQDPTPGRFDLVLSYGAGAASDPEGKAGVAELARLLTDRARAGGPGAPRRADRELALTVRNESWTSLDETVFRLQGPTSKLDEILTIERERLTSPLLGIDEEELVPTRAELVRSWRAGETLDRIQSRVVLAAAMAGHPYARAALGSFETLRSVRLEDVRAFAAASLVPANAILVVSTDLDAHAVARRVAEALGSAAAPGPGGGIPPSAPAAGALLAEPAVSAGLDVRRGPFPRPRLWLTWVTGGVRNPSWSSEVLAASVVQDAVALRLWSWRERKTKIRGLAQVQYAMAEAQVLGLVVDLATEEDAASVLAEAREALAGERVGRLATRLAERGPELSRELLVQGDPPLAGVATLIRAGHGADYVVAARVMLAGQLSPDAVDRSLAENLSPGRLRGTLFAPAQEEGASADRVLYTPPIGERQFPSATFEPPDGATAAELVRAATGTVSLRTLENGLTLVEARRPGVARLAVSLAFHLPAAPADAAAERLQWLALATAKQRWPFASTRPCRVPRGARAGGQLHYASSGDRAVAAGVLRLVHCATDGVSVNDFTFGRLRDGVATALREPRTEPVAPVQLAELEFCRAVAPSQAFGLQPRAEEVERLMPWDADAWLEAVLRPERAALAVVGDPSPEVEADALRLFGEWKARPAEPISEPELRLPARGRAVVVALPGARDAWVRVGVPRWDPRGRDRIAALALLLHVDTRLQRGGGTAVRGDFRVGSFDLETASGLDVSARVSRGSVGPLLDRIAAAFAEAARAPMTARDASVARWAAARAIALASWTEADAAAYLAAAAARRGGDVLDLPADVAALGPERIQAAARSLALDRMVAVVVGDPDALLPQLRSAGFEVEVVKPPAPEKAQAPSTPGTPASPPG